MSHRFIVTLEEDQFGDLVLPIPDQVLEELGWTIGDNIDYTIDEDSLILKKSNE
jgi:bifunctional DNA-binding transcriptional regulator/antitoxin component of YhaV-PrlF toxin-antitoxin module